jgi:hypothetical protein
MTFVLVNPLLDVAGNTNVKSSGFTAHYVDIECFHSDIFNYCGLFIKQKELNRFLGSAPTLVFDKKSGGFARNDVQFITPQLDQ